MKRLLALLIAISAVFCLQCSSGNGGKKHNKGPLEGYALICYCGVNTDASHDEIDIHADGFAVAGHVTPEGAVENLKEGSLSDTQMDELKNLLIAAGFDFSGSEMTYGAAGPGDKLYGILIRYEKSDEKTALIWGETPADAPSEYLTLRDYLRSLQQQIVNQ
jgi:hypothetical protein